MAQETMDVTVIFDRDIPENREIRVYKGCSGIGFDAQTGLVTIQGMMGRPLALFLMTPFVRIETEPNLIARPQLQLQA